MTAPCSILSVTAEIEPIDAGHYMRTRYRWSRAVHVSVDMPERGVPLLLSGHRFLYRLGGGKRPGIVAMKDGGKLMCGMDPDETPGADAFRSVPELALVE